MKDQSPVNVNESKSDKYNRAVDLFIESVHKPDTALRSCAHNQRCFNELMEIREHVLDYLKTLREVTRHTNPDESDDIETAKLQTLKSK